MDYEEFARMCIGRRDPGYYSAPEGLLPAYYSDNDFFYYKKTLQRPKRKIINQKNPGPYKIRISIDQRDFHRSFPFIFDVLSHPQFDSLTQFKVVNDMDRTRPLEARFLNGAQYTLYFDTDLAQMLAEMLIIRETCDVKKRSKKDIRLKGLQIESIREAKYFRPFYRPHKYDPFLPYGPTCMPNIELTQKLVRILHDQLTLNDIQPGNLPESDIPFVDRYRHTSLNYLSGRFDGFLPFKYSNITGNGYVPEENLKDDGEHKLALDFMFQNFVDLLIPQTQQNFENTPKYVPVLKTPIVKEWPGHSTNARGFILSWQEMLLSDKSFLNLLQKPDLYLSPEPEMRARGAKVGGGAAASSSSPQASGASALGTPPFIASSAHASETVALPQSVHILFEILRKIDEAIRNVILESPVFESSGASDIYLTYLSQIQHLLPPFISAPDYYRLQPLIEKFLEVHQKYTTILSTLPRTPKPGMVPGMPAFIVLYQEMNKLANWHM